MQLALVICSVTSALGQVEGYTRPYRDVQLAAPEAGILEQLEVKRGDRVVAGQKVAFLARGLVRARLAIALARASDGTAVAMRQAELSLSERRHLRMKELAKRGSARADEVARVEVELAIAKARLEAARAEVAILKLEVEASRAQLAQREVVSPISGVVADVLVEVGERVSMSEPAVMRVVDTSKLRLRVNMPIARARQLTIGAELPVLEVGSGKQARGRVVFVSPDADAASATVQVELLLPNAQGALQSGARCRIEVD